MDNGCWPIIIHFRTLVRAVRPSPLGLSVVKPKDNVSKRDLDNIHMKFKDRVESKSKYVR